MTWRWDLDSRPSINPIYRMGSGFLGIGTKFKKTHKTSNIFSEMVVFGDLLMVQKSTKKSPKTTTNPRDISGLETILHLSSVQDFFSGTWRYQTWSYYLPIGSMHGIFTYMLFDFYGTWRQLYMDPKGYSYRFWEQLDRLICDFLGC